MRNPSPPETCDTSGRGRRLAAAWTVCGVLLLAACKSADPGETPSAAEYAPARAQLVVSLRAHGISDARVLAAIGRVPRHEFVRPQDHALAYADRALPIAGGQTISQPYVVALMSQLLELRGDERVLEVGTGSGYQAAILATLAREVYSIEIDAALAEQARQRLQLNGYHNVKVRAGDGFYGWEEFAPFDAVIVTAAAPRIPERLVSQLKADGRLVIPLGKSGRQRLVRGRKQGGALKLESFAQVAFVPMTGAVRQPTP